MMMEKERGILEGAKFSHLWEISTPPEGGRRCLCFDEIVANCMLLTHLRYFSYRHVITGTCQKSHPMSVFGGILADVSSPFTVKASASHLTTHRRWVWVKP
jgi:hypothetical protein